MGKPLNGSASFGYKWENKQFVIDEKEAPIRKLVYELFLKHKRRRSVAKELNDMGYRTKNGSKFSDTTINRLLSDPTAKGLRLTNHTLDNGKKRKPEADWISVPCDPIVSEGVWNACNEILNDQRKKRRSKGPKSVHLLAGLVICTCGKKMYVFHSKSAIYTCTNCKNRITVETLDEIYYDQLKTFLLTDVDVKTYLQKSDVQIQEKEKLLALATDGAQRIRRRKNELVNMRLDGEMTKESFMEEFKPLEERLIQLQESVPVLQAEVDFLKIQIASSDLVLHEAKNLYDRWPALDYEDKRNIVETITEKITVGKDDVTLSLSYLPSLPQNPVKSQHDH
jgi:site-specific DNA recombinase